MRHRLIARLVVFDLDHTLWPFGVDNFVFKPPYNKRKDRVEDAVGQRMQPFPQIDSIFTFLEKRKIPVAVASRTEYPEGAKRLLDLFEWRRHIKYEQIYPGSKVTHFNEFRKQTSFAFEEMLFFDDEERNIVDIRPLGVTAVLVNPDTGVTLQNVTEALRTFEESS